MILLARTTVQFQSILDKFSPHDTVFSLASASELTESALSSACLLHAASGSMTSSTSSLRHRRLMEITEDAEENGVNKDEASTKSNDTADKRSVYSHQSEATAVPPGTADGSEQADHTSPRSRAGDTPSRRRPSAASEHHPERPLPQRHLLEQLSEPAYEPRMSSQSTRPSFQDLDPSSFYRPKVKLGPRPSMDNNGRPRTAGSLSRERDIRPVASLPAGVRPSTVRRTNPNAPRPKSQPGSILSISAPGRVPAVPPLLVPPPSLGIVRPPISPGARSLVSLSGIAPEKERLMKALEMRKKQMEKRAENKKKEQNQLPKGNSVLDATENKENIGAIQVKESQIHEKPPAESDSLQRKEPLSESCQAAAFSEKQPQTVTKPTSPSSSNPDSAVDIVVGSPDGSQSSNSVTPVVPATSSFSANESNVETAQITTKDPDATDLIVKENQETPKQIATGFGPSVVDSEKPSDRVDLSETSKAETSESSTGENLDSTLTPEEISRPKSPPQAASAMDDNTQEPEITDSEARDQKNKKKANLEPIHIVSAQEFSDDENLLSDDSFMEELKSATVQEAKPIPVGKSPVSSMYSGKGDASDGPRAVSNPGALGQTGSDLQALPVGRSISGSYFENNKPAAQVLVAKKVNVSSGISKRIKALEKFSNSRDSSSNTLQPVVPAPSTSAFEKFRKRASFSMAGGIPPSTANTSTPHTKSSAYLTPSPSPEPNSKARSLSQESTSSAARGKTNSVSVTARIVRDPNAPPSDPAADPSEPSALNLQRSPLIVESDPAQSTRPASPLHVTTTNSKSEGRSMSISSTGSKGDSSAIAATRSGSVASVLSSRSKADGNHSTTDLASSPESKKESRASRLMRRMSSMTSNSRKSVMNALSPTLKEEAQRPPEKEDDLPPVPPQVVDIGEVNVQFPDTLLWKRRFMRIDEQGYLVLTPGNVDSSTRNIIKRYHLSEFNKPYLPDQDIQELPNSIVLDFRDGSTLQCACESRQGQAAVLQSKHFLPRLNQSQANVQ